MTFNPCARRASLKSKKPSLGMGSESVWVAGVEVGIWSLSTAYAWLIHNYKGKRINCSSTRTRQRVLTLTLALTLTRLGELGILMVQVEVITSKRQRKTKGKGSHTQHVLKKVKCGQLGLARPEVCIQIAECVLCTQLLLIFRLGTGDS